MGYTGGDTRTGLGIGIFIAFIISLVGLFFFLSCHYGWFDWAKTKKSDDFTSSAKVFGNIQPNSLGRNVNNNQSVHLMGGRPYAAQMRRLSMDHHHGARANGPLNELVITGPQTSKEAFYVRRGGNCCPTWARGDCTKCIDDNCGCKHVDKRMSYQLIKNSLADSTQNL